MNRVIISCKMLEDELNYVRKKKQKQNAENINNANAQNVKIIEIKRGMHNQPKSLYEVLQKLIDANQYADEIVLTYGLCGNGTLGLVSSHTKLILPRVDDCINQLLYTQESVQRAYTKKGHMYLTKGWTIDKESMLHQCEQIMKDYGDAGKEIIDQIYEGYHTLTVIDTKSYVLEDVIREAEEIGKYKKINVEVVDGNLSFLDKIISGTYDDSFIILNPGEKVTEEMFRINGK